MNRDSKVPELREGSGRLSWTGQDCPDRPIRTEVVLARALSEAEQAGGIVVAVMTDSELLARQP